MQSVAQFEEQACLTSLPRAHHRSDAVGGREPPLKSSQLVTATHKKSALRINRTFGSDNSEPLVNSFKAASSCHSKPSNSRTSLGNEARRKQYDVPRRSITEYSSRTLRPSSMSRGLLMSYRASASRTSRVVNVGPGTTRLISLSIGSASPQAVPT